MLQVVKCLPCQNEGWSSVPRTLINNLGVVAYAGNLSAGEAETGGSQALTGEFRQVTDPVS